MEKSTSFKNIRSLLGLKETKPAEVNAPAAAIAPGDPKLATKEKRKSNMASAVELEPAPLKISEPILIRTTSTRFAPLPKLAPAPPAVTATVDRRPSISHSPAPPVGPSPHPRRKSVITTSSSGSAESMRSASSPVELVNAIGADKRRSDLLPAETAAGNDMFLLMLIDLISAGCLIISRRAGQGELALL